MIEDWARADPRRELETQQSLPPTHLLAFTYGIDAVDRVTSEREAMRRLAEELTQAGLYRPDRLRARESPPSDEARRADLYRELTHIHRPSSTVHPPHDDFERRQRDRRSATVIAHIALQAPPEVYAAARALAAASADDRDDAYVHFVRLGRADAPWIAD